MLLTKKQTADLCRETATIIQINDSICTVGGSSSSFSSGRWEREVYKWVAKYLDHGYSIDEIIRGMQEIVSHWYGCECFMRTGNLFRDPIYAGDMLAVLHSMREHGYYECDAIRIIGPTNDHLRHEPIYEGEQPGPYS